MLPFSGRLTGSSRIVLKRHKATRELPCSESRRYDKSDAETWETNMELMHGGGNAAPDGQAAEARYGEQELGAGS